MCYEAEPLSMRRRPQELRPFSLLSDMPSSEAECETRVAASTSPLYLQNVDRKRCSLFLNISMLSVFFSVLV